ncbi:MAG: hypothetical protein HQK93_00680, partial [Nitrospirae bacterium]|nr:hypothetical protein [Nitrospirota bacterium]
DRQGEALRMSVGITVMDDIVNVFVLDKTIESNEENDMNVEMIKEMDIPMLTNFKPNEDKGMEYISTEDLAKKLLEYNNILCY